MKLHWKIAISSIIVLAPFWRLLLLKYHPFACHTVTHFSDASDDSLADYYQTAQQLASQNQTSSTTVTFLAVGDINLSRNVASQILKQNNVTIRFWAWRTILKSTDFNFANLESPIAPAGQRSYWRQLANFWRAGANAQALKRL